MAVEMSIAYTGELHCELEHRPSGTRLETDAPVDNMGRGSSFSPTDLVGAALISCALTTMAIKGAKEGIPFGDARGKVLKEMTGEGPRRIAKLEVELEMPAGLDAAQRARLEEIARTCPVALSLGEGVAKPMRFVYRD